jgi:hypothetical protein
MTMRDRLWTLVQIPALLLLGIVWSGVVGLNKIRAWDAIFTAWAYRPEQRKAWRLFSRLGDGWLYAGFSPVLGFQQMTMNPNSLITSR